MGGIHEMAPLMMLSGVNTPVCAVYLINKPLFVIGKAADCDAVLHFSSEISRKHAQISWADGRYTLIDLGSTNHTYLNGKMLIPNQPYPIRERDMISFSGFTFVAEQLTL